jgi:hypothetical protein
VAKSSSRSISKLATRSRALLALSALTAACGGQTSDEPAKSNNEPPCPQAASVDGRIGNGPLDELVGAVRAIRDIEAATRSALFDEVGALGQVYGVLGRGERLGMSELAAAIADDIAKSTAAGIAAELGAVGCTEDGQAAATSEARCLAEGCDQCDAAALCAEMARLNGLATATCSGPSFNVSFAAAPGLQADQLIQLQTRVGELQLRGTRILAAYARLSAIVEGTAFDGVIFDPSPAREVRDELEALVTGKSFGIRVACAPYAVPFLTTAVSTLGDVGTNTPYLFRERDQFVALFQQ